MITRIGGKHSTVKLAAGAATAFQHDASSLGNGHDQRVRQRRACRSCTASRARWCCRSTRKTDTESVLAQFVHPQPLSSGSQGNAQPLPNGNLFIGWGAQPYFSEFNSANQLVYDAHWHGSYQSYRSYRFPWTGAPPHGPALVADGRPSASTLTAYVSWNGDTRTASWRLLGGASPHDARAADDGRRRPASRPPSRCRPAAPTWPCRRLDGSGNVIGTSGTIKG